MYVLARAYVGNGSCERIGQATAQLKSDGWNRRRLASVLAKSPRHNPPGAAAHRCSFKVLQFAEWAPYSTATHANPEMKAFQAHGEPHQMFYLASYTTVPSKHHSMSGELRRLHRLGPVRATSAGWIHPCRRPCSLVIPLFYISFWTSIENPSTGRRSVRVAQ